MFFRWFYHYLGFCKTHRFNGTYITVILQTQTFFEKKSLSILSKNCITVMSFTCIYIFLKNMYNLCIADHIKADSCAFLQSYCKQNFSTRRFVHAMFWRFCSKKMSGWTWHLQRIFGENIFMLFAFSKSQTHTCTYMLSMAMI